MLGRYSLFLTPDSFANFFFNQFPDAVEITDEFGRPLHCEAAGSGEVYDDLFFETSGAGRQNKNPVGKKYRLIDLVGDEHDCSENESVRRQSGDNARFYNCWDAVLILPP